MLSLAVSGSSGSTITMPQTPTPGEGGPQMSAQIGAQMGVGMHHPGGAGPGQGHGSGQSAQQGQGQGQRGFGNAGESVGRMPGWMS
jgi:hypothetical protein